MDRLDRGFAAGVVFAGKRPAFRLGRVAQQQGRRSTQTSDQFGIAFQTSHTYKRASKAQGMTMSEPDVGGSSLWQRIKSYLQIVLPKPLAGLASTGLLPVAAWGGAIFLLVVFLPLLSILALNMALRLVPDDAAKWSRSAFVSAIHKGYGIDEVREELRRDASAEVLAKMMRNNESLDYVQYVEFLMTKRDQPKEIPVRLHIGQRAKIVVRRSQISPLPGAAKDCALPDLPPSEEVLRVSLDNFFVRSLPQMEAAGERGNIALTKDWWDQNLQKVKAETSISADGIASVLFHKTARLEQLMNACNALKVEAIVEVFKQDPGMKT